MPLSAWVHSLGRQPPDSNTRVLEALAQAGVVARPLEDGRPTGVGIVLFSEINPPLLEHLRAVSRRGRERVLAVADLSGSAIDGNPWEVLEAGASDLIVWRDPEEATAQIVARLERWNSIEEILRSPLVQQNLVGRSLVWQSVLRRIIEVARFANGSVLLLGESGTGKELLARLIHTLDVRAEKPNLIVVDCTTIVPELAGSEFFGHERGAFTGATMPRDGAFALANGGTLFLDEVGELPPAMQAQLLRVVQEQTYKPIGANSWRHTSFRLVCATNRDLSGDVERGSFRGDLYYRIATWVLRVPPLRERREDIVPLAEHFLSKVNGGNPAPELNETLQRFLVNRPYPGNVRELGQLVSRIGQRHVGGGAITIGDVPEEDRERGSGSSPFAEWRDDGLEEVVRRALILGVGLREITQAAAEVAIHIAVSEAEGNLHQAARRLGVTDRALQLRRAKDRRLTA